MAKKKAVTVPPKLTESDSYDVLRVQNSKPGVLPKTRSILLKFSCSLNNRFDYSKKVRSCEMGLQIYEFRNLAVLALGIQRAPRSRHLQIQL
jgi:hypothetical protein